MELNALTPEQLLQLRDNANETLKKNYQYKLKFVRYNVAGPAPPLVMKIYNSIRGGTDTYVLNTDLTDPMLVYIVEQLSKLNKAFVEHDGVRLWVSEITMLPGYKFTWSPAPDFDPEHPVNKVVTLVPMEPPYKSLPTLSLPENHEMLFTNALNEFSN